MATERSHPQPKLLEVNLAGISQAEEALHPGWVRATAILLRGLQRIEEGEAEND